MSPLSANRNFAFQGFLPGAKFDIPSEVAEGLLALTDAAYSEVVLPYLDGRDIARTVDQQPTRYAIDFAQMELEEAMRRATAKRGRRARLLPSGRRRRLLDRRRASRGQMIRMHTL